MEGVPLVEGSIVTVVSREVDAPFVLTTQDEEELLAAMAEISRGEFVPAEELLESLREHG